MSSKRREDHEISMRTGPAGRLTDRDRKALTPLIWGHVNPYGRQELDMRTRVAALA